MINGNSKRVVISGVGIISSLGNNFEDFVINLREGKSGVDKIRAFNSSGLRTKYGCEIKGFDPTMYFTRRELHRMDRSSQILLVAVREAVKRSGLDFSQEDREKCGVSLGTIAGGITSGMNYYYSFVKNKISLRHLLLEYPLYSAGTRVCVEYNLKGPNIVISTACSASNVAIGYGFDLIKNSQADIMIVGGFEAMSEFICSGFGVLRNTAPELCRPFDKNRKGLIIGEAAGCMVIGDLGHCLRRGAKIFAEILGYGMSSDAYHMISPDITGKGPALAMSRAIEESGVTPRMIDYINAHGTGTRYNDLIETRAIKKVFGNLAYNIPVSSTKSMVGHTMGASGAVEIIASLAGINYDFVPPTINYETPDSNCDLDYVPNLSRIQKVNIVLSNSFGFGGNNCSLIIKRAKL